MLNGCRANNARTERYMPGSGRPGCVSHRRYQQGGGGAADPYHASLQLAWHTAVDISDGGCPYHVLFSLHCTRWCINQRSMPFSIPRSSLASMHKVEHTSGGCPCHASLQLALHSVVHVKAMDVATMLVFRLHCAHGGVRTYQRWTSLPRHVRTTFGVGRLKPLTQQPSSTCVYTSVLPSRAHHSVEKKHI